MVVYAYYEVVTHLLGKRLAEQPLMYVAASAEFCGVYFGSAAPVPALRFQAG